MDYHQLREMIDACRPGSDDIDLPDVSPLADRIAADPDLRHRYQRTQRLDARLVRAIDDVDVPAGLRERILARFAEQGSGVRDQGPEPAESPEATALAVPVQDRGAALVPTRRRWLLTIAAVAAGLLLLVTGYAFWPRHTALTYDSLLNLSGQWHEQLRANPAWQALAPREVIRDFPVAEAIRPRPRNWADVSSLVGQAACAYDLTAPGGPRATLFVIADEGQIAGSAVPLNPDSSTGGLMIGCWQSGAFVYVLVVEGNEWTYRSLLNDAGQPLAGVWFIFRPLEGRIAIGLEAEKCA